MSNSVNLSLDVTKTGIQNPLIKVRQGDGGFETLRTTVTANGEPMDLQGWTITFMGTTAGNHKIVDDNVTIVEAPNGIFDYTPSKVWGIDIGEFKIAYFKFVKGDGSASSANFRVNVIEAVDLTQEEAQNYISVVDATIAEAKQHLTDSLASVTASVAATSSTASSMAVYVSSTASSAVNTINNTTSSAVSQVNSAASSASSVASSAATKVSGVAAQVNSLSIGGRNLILNSRLLGISANVNVGKIEKVPYDVNTNMWHITAPAGSSVNAGIYFEQAINTSKVIEPGQQWVFSFDIKGTGFYSDKHVGVENSNPFNSPTGNVPSSWTRIVSTGVSRGSNIVIIYFNASSSPLDVYIKLPKLEAGNIATDWTPAPEDKANKVKTVYNIEDYGAKSFDMNFDNGKVINDILAKIGDNGGTILIPAGDFWITTPIIIKRNYITIQGINSGFRSNIDAEVGNGLSHPGAGSHLLLMPSLENGIIIGEKGKTPRISGITIDRINIQGARERSATVSQTGINIIQDNDGVTISNNVIMNLNYGVIGNGSDAIAIRNNWICELQNAVHLLNSSQQPSITNNYFGAQPSGITLKLNSAMCANISGNNIYPDGFTNIELNNCSMSIISGNNIQSFYAGMIMINGGNNNSISSNMIYARSNGGNWVVDPLGRDNKYGIIQISSDNTTVTANHIISEQPIDATRILVRKGNNIRISSNTILGNPSKNKIVCNGTDSNNVVVFNSVNNNEFDSGLNANNRNVWSVYFDDEFVHKTGTETIAGDKTFTGNTNFTGDISQKTFINTGNGNGVTWTAHRTGNFVFLTIQGKTAASTSTASVMSGFKVNEGMRPVDTATNAIRNTTSGSTVTGALRHDGSITFDTNIPAGVYIVGSFTYSIS